MGSGKTTGDDSYPGQLQCQSSAGDRGPVAGRVCKSGKSGISRGKGEGRVVHAGVNCVCNVWVLCQLKWVDGQWQFC